ncbi:hypothetical protein B0H13DRAFT_1873346 [Mycena leptocephala]|nr:hypothetical protein B0H13DRAFT_1873346 [Mycena leptocephala]
MSVHYVADTKSQEKFPLWRLASTPILFSLANFQVFFGVAVTIGNGKSISAVWDGSTNNGLFGYFLRKFGGEAGTSGFGTRNEDSSWRGRQGAGNEQPMSAHVGGVRRPQARQPWVSWTNVKVEQGGEAVGLARNFEFRLPGSTPHCRNVDFLPLVHFENFSDCSKVFGGTWMRNERRPYGPHRQTLAHPCGRKRESGSKERVGSMAPTAPSFRILEFQWTPSPDLSILSHSPPGSPPLWSKAGVWVEREGGEHGSNCTIISDFGPHRPTLASFPTLHLALHPRGRKRECGSKERVGSMAPTAPSFRILDPIGRR